MSLGKEDIDKLVRTVTDTTQVYEDIVAAKESGDKITFIEGAALAVKHAGKAFRFISDIQEIGAEVIDIESNESQELIQKLIEALKQIYALENPLIEEGAKSILKGIISLKEGLELIITAKKDSE